jgi:hypothetical protein
MNCESRSRQRAKPVEIVFDVHHRGGVEDLAPKRFEELEASEGIEPPYKDLQSSA